MIENSKQWVRRQGRPLSVGIIAALIVTSLLNFFVPAVAQALYFNAGDIGQRPWALLTYPLAFSGLGDPFQLLWFILLLFWVMFAGGFLERDAGIGKAAAFWVGATILSALAVGVAAIAMKGGPPLSGPYLPVAAVTVYWGVRNKDFPVMLWGILPLKGIYIAIISVAGTFFGYGAGGGTSFVVGLAACLHLGVAWLLAEKSLIRIPALAKRSKAQIERDEKFEDDVRRRRQERDEVERLRRLLEGPTGGDDR